jgi:hypothetical protein
MRFTKKQVDEVARKSRKKYVITRRLAFLLGLIIGIGSTVGGYYGYENWDEYRDYLNQYFRPRSNIVVIRTPVIIP